MSLAVTQLEKHFDGVSAVDRLSLKFPTGKIVGVIGPNGSGKSTLVNLLTGLLPADGGSIVVGERAALASVRPFDAPAYGLGRTFQDVRLFEQMPVLDNILVVLTDRRLGAALLERTSDFHHSEAKTILEFVGLWEKRQELAANLSYGQRKLLEVARLLALARVYDIEYFLFDEPFAGLFPQMVPVVTGVLKDLRAKGKTVILIEHNMELIRELSDHVIVLDAGKLLAEGEPDEVLARPEVIEAYLGE